MINGRDPVVPGFDIVNAIDNDRHPVYLARDPKGTDVAIKMLDRAKDPILPRRFDLKRRALVKLAAQHHGIATLLASGVTEDGQEYVVTPYQPIGSLQDQLDHGPLPWHPAAVLVANVSDAVSIIHGAGIALGGLQPSAILLEDVDRPIVGAFGLPNRWFDNGRPIFAAPEALLHKPETVPPSDVYSVGLIFGALVTGRAKGREEPVSEFLADVGQVVPSRILDVVERALATSPTNRYRDCAMLQRAFKAAMEPPADELAAASAAELATTTANLDADDVLAPLTVAEPVPAVTELPPGLEDIIFTPTDDVLTLADIEDPLLPPGLGDLKLAGNGKGVPNGNGADNGTHAGIGSQHAADAEPAVVNGDEDTSDGLVPADLDAVIDLTDLTPRQDDEATLTGFEQNTVRFDDDTTLTGLETEVLTAHDQDRTLTGFDPTETVDLTETIERMERTGAVADASAPVDPSSSESTTEEASREEAAPVQPEPVIDLDRASTAGDTPDLEVLDREEFELEALQHTSELDLDDLGLAVADRETEDDRPAGAEQNGAPSDARQNGPIQNGAEEDGPNQNGAEQNGTEHGDEPDYTDAPIYELDDTYYEHPAFEEPTFDGAVLDLAELEAEDRRTSAGATLVLDPTETDGGDETAVDRTEDKEEGDDSDADRSDDNGDASPVAVDTPAALYADDITDIFGDDPGPEFEPVEADEDGRVPALAGAAAGIAGVPFINSEPVPVEDIPFRGVSGAGDTAMATAPGWFSRLRVAIEVAWFQSRRNLASGAAVLGLLAIAGVVVYFGANEIRSSVETGAEGVLHTPSTVADPEYVPTDGPFLIEVPATNSTTTTTRPRLSRAPTTSATERK
ncbi:MAG: hypothetical protein AAF531_18645 [Actinomycetota bacterium]